MPRDMTALKPSIIRQQNHPYTKQKSADDTSLNSLIETRLIKERKVNELLSDIPTNLFRVCFSGSNTEFKNKLTNVKEIGKGGFGTVYYAKIQNYSFVVKEVLAPERDLPKLVYSVGKTRLNKNSYTEEYRIMTLTNNALYSEKCPNFLLAYNLAVCEGCGTGQTCFVSFVEAAYGDLYKLQEFPDNLVISLLYQILLGLHWIHSTFGIFHNDLKKENILLLPVKPGGYFAYVINGKTYLVENVGWIFMINDFGVSLVLKPTFSTGNYYGIRNARVDSSKKLVPITCKRAQTIEQGPIYTETNVNVIKWNDGEKTGTENIFGGTLNLEPDVIVNLNDTDIFPPFEFFVDIQNVILMIVGGSLFNYISPLWFVIRKEHDPMPISNKLKSKISKLVHNSFEYFDTSTPLLRADLLIDWIYTSPNDDFNQNIIDTFKF